MRIAHTSDWHMGKRLGWIDRTPDIAGAIGQVAAEAWPPPSKASADAPPNRPMMVLSTLCPFSIVGTQTPNEIRRKKFQFMTSFAAGYPDHYALSRRNRDYSRAIRAETGACAGGGSSAKRWR